MKRGYRNLGLLSLSGLICLFLAFPAYAQHHRSGGGGGGGGHFSGGAHFTGGTHFSGGGHATFSRSPRTYSTAPRARVYSNGRSYSGHAYNGRVGVNAYRGRVGVNAYRGRVGVNAYRGRVGYYGRGYYRRGAWYGRGWYGGWHGWFAPGGWYFHSGFYASLYYPRIGFSVGFLPYGYYPFYWDDMPYYYSDGYFYQYDDNQYTVVEPPIGAEVNALPNGARSIIINGQQFYELNGVYYVAITKDDGSLAYQVAGKDGELNTGDQSDQGYNDQGDDQGTYAPAPDNQQQYANPPADQQYNNAPADQQNDNAPANVQDNNPNGPQIGDLVAELPKGCRRITINGQKLYVSPDDVYYQDARDNNNQKAYKIVGLPSDDSGN